jgi:hypothetical protein
MPSSMIRAVSPVTAPAGLAASAADASRIHDDARMLEPPHSAENATGAQRSTPAAKPQLTNA